MNNTNHINHHAVKGIQKLIEQMEPLGERKSPAIGAAAGLCGAAGILLYLRNPRDFWLSFGICVVVLILAAPTGETMAILAPIICAYYAYTRVKASNAALDAREKNGRVIEAEVIVEPIQSAAMRIPTPPVIAQSTPAATLRTLDHLFGERLISYAEYEERRRQVLSQL